MTTGMSFSTETLTRSLETLTADEATRWIGLAGGVRNLNTLIAGLTRNFEAKVSDRTYAVLAEASARWNRVNRHPLVSYKVD